MMADLQLIDHALAYASKGIPLFPTRGKSPLTTHGHHDSSTDPEIITGWWTEHPTAGIGVPTGEITGFDVLDVDGEEGFESLKQYEAEHGPVPDTFVVITGRGLHYYLQHVPGMRNRTGFLPGLDIRGEGGYVVVPPSLHESGAPYRWKGASPW